MMVAEETAAAVVLVLATPKWKGDEPRQKERKRERKREILIPLLLLL